MAKQKGDYPEIYDELTRIRRDADDGLTPHVLAASPALCRLLGNGDPFLATGDLRDRIATAAARRDREILAYYYSLAPGKDSTARLIEAGERLAVEYRRARDLSDLGALKLAQIIGSDREWQVPFMGCGLSIRGWEVAMKAYVMVATGFKNYNHPKFTIDGQEVELAYSCLDGEAWERHAYGPIIISLDSDRHQIQMRRIGTPKIRVNLSISSNNPDVRVDSSLVLLDYVASLTLHRNIKRSDG
ncbi:hypothetical protein [Mycobacteroides abscessus]|uniref:hypothetical protein n=1 Tax=Mycobacteroides abscessus TaxID=36809 RepID=UPI0009A74844|nr:hypothetical protein [Mycobacteroides abscessus]SKO16264.1 Uncharacterised protein [Mycobacteroides abscessus subsp. massiliense]